MKRYIAILSLILIAFTGYSQLAGKIASNYIDDLSYGITWDQSQSAVAKPAMLKSGNPNLWVSLPVQNKLKRCVLRDDGTVAYYLSSTNSWNKDGISPYVTAKNPSSISVLPNKILSTGNFGDTSLHVGMAVHNTTDNTYAMIVTIHSGDSVTVGMPLPMTVRKWRTATGTTTGHLIDAGINYSSLGVVTGDLVWNRTDNTYALVTNVATGDLTISADIMASAELYTVQKPFIKIGDAFEICTANLSGSDGQVMVECPLFYERYSFSGTTHDFRISEFPLPEFEPHPWFVSGTVVKPFRYFSAYEGNIVSTKLQSVAGVLPTTSQTRATFRTNAANRGSGWSQQSYFALSAIQLLYVTEYANWNSQSTIGAGATDWSGAVWNNYNAYNPVNRSGLSNFNGNVTANLNNGDGIVGSFMSYRGIEHFFGDIYKFTDGINIFNHVPYICGNEASFADDKKFAGYFQVGVTLPSTDGYQTTLTATKYGFLPSAVGGNATTYICDQYYQSTGWRVVLSGGSLYHGAVAGVAFFDAGSASSFVAAHVGSRLCK